jgi:hypothetical protein
MTGVILMKSRAQRRVEKLQKMIRGQIADSFERERLLDKLITEEHYIGVMCKNIDYEELE